MKKGNLIEFTVHSKVQIDQINKTMTEFMQYLKQALKNSEIRIKFIETEKEETTYVTSDEKFKKMTETNPELLNLKKSLDLEIDFV